MKYAREVIELMSAYPERNFKMIEIVRHANPNPKSKKERSATHRGALRVLDMLTEMGMIFKIPSRAGNGGYTLYRWKTTT